MPIDTNINPHPPHECLIPGEAPRKVYIFAPSSELDFFEDDTPHTYQYRHATANRPTCLACDLPFDDPIHVKEQPLA
jgi:hypothetical protein